MVGVGLGAGLSVGEEENNLEGLVDGRRLGLNEFDGDVLGGNVIVGEYEGVADGEGLGAGDSVGELSSNTSTSVEAMHGHAPNRSMRERGFNLILVRLYF